MRSSRKGLDFGFDPAGEGIPGRLEVVQRLEVHPELGTRSEEPGEAEGNLSRNGAITAQHTPHVAFRHSNPVRQSAGIHGQRHEEILAQHVAGTNGREIGHRTLVSMIINDFHIICVALAPYKANPPLGIDSDAVLP